MQSATNAQKTVEMGTTISGIASLGDINSANDSSAVAGDYVADANTLATQTTALDGKFNSVKQSAASVQAHHTFSNLEFYKHIVEMMLFFLEAIKLNGYLETICKMGKGATFKLKVAHGTNFAPLIAAVWASIGKSDLVTNKTNRISRAMNAVQKEYEANLALYSTNTVDTLATFIENSGGISGLVSYKTNAANDEGDSASDNEADLQLCKSSKHISHEEMLNLQKEALAHYKNAPSLPTVKFSSQVSLNEDDCALMLISKKPNGNYVVVNQNTDSEAIAKTVTQQFNGDFTSLPTSIRVITETTATQCLPYVMQHTHKKLIEEAGKFSDGQKRNVVRRLVYKSNEDTFLMSAIRADSSLVTIACPKKPVIEQVDYDLHLSTISRRALEKAIVSPRQFKTYEPVNLGFTDVYPCNPTDDLHVVSLKPKHTNEEVDAKSVNLYFGAELTDSEFFSQVDIADLGNVTPLWERTVPAVWFKTFNATFTNKWVKSHGQNISRPHQTVLELEFKRTLLCVNFFKKGSEYNTELSVSVDINEGKSYSKPCNVLSKDFAVAMHSLGDLPLINEATLRLFNGYLEIKYETDAANYLLYIPIATEDGKRKVDGFTKYQLVRKANERDDMLTFETGESGEVSA